MPAAGGEGLECRDPMRGVAGEAGSGVRGLLFESGPHEKQAVTLGQSPELARLLPLPL